jgi:hypothetical protein
MLTETYIECVFQLKNSNTGKPEPMLSGVCNQQTEQRHITVTFRLPSMDGSMMGYWLGWVALYQ